jgi:Trp operon repressor
VKNITDEPLKVLHSFRATFKDMLRDAGVTAEMVKLLESGEVTLSEFADAINSGRVSKDLNDRITGHSQKDVAGKYGLGEALITRAAAIEKLDLAFLPG